MRCLPSRTRSAAPRSSCITPARRACGAGRSAKAKRSSIRTTRSGSPTRVLAASGEVVWAARYTPWGAASVVIGDASFNPLRLQGQYADAETGLHYNRHRYYDPVIGQFISQDPIGLLAGTNPYRFGPNALTWIDPLGFDTHYLTGWIERNGQQVTGTRRTCTAAASRKTRRAGTVSSRTPSRSI